MTTTNGAKIASKFDRNGKPSVPSNQKEEAEEGNQIVNDEVTEFIRDPETAMQVVVRQIEHANLELLGIGRRDAPAVLSDFEPYRNSMLKASQKLKAGECRYITDITNANLDSVKFLQNELNVKVRHLDGIRSNLLINENEYVADLSPLHSHSPATNLLYSNSKELLGQQRQLFETLWNVAIPAEKRLREIEEVIFNETRVLSQYSDVEDQLISITKAAKTEVRLLLPTLERLELAEFVFRAVAEKATSEHIRVRVLAPFPSDLEKTERITKQYSMFEMRPIDPIKLGLAISDESRLLFVQYGNIEIADPEKAITSGIYATQKETISSIVSIYETMWASSKVREKEAKSRKQAELLQDILAHDIRNYNQVARLSAELLRDEVKDNSSVQSIVESLLKAVDGSTHLLDRAKKLGKVLSDENPLLYSMDVREVLHNSLSLIKMSFQHKSINLTETYLHGLSDNGATDDSAVLVKADDLLGEVFVNIFSNCVIYTEGENVQIELKVEDRSHGDSPAGLAMAVQPYWVISVSDHGRGIPDDVKPKMFSRYLENAKGSGLGMSIVHALGVERYKGLVKVQNRIQGDYSKGTTVEIWLPKA